MTFQEAALKQKSVKGWGKDSILRDNAERFFIITGGPGSGKTSLLDALEKMNYKRSVEAGRGIIQQQVAIGGRALPWDDKLLFAELMLSWEVRSYQIAEQWAGIVFFDRGVPDVAAYLMLSNMPVPRYVQKAIETFHYNPPVFIAPPWREIFTQDRERKQDFEEAIRTYEALVETYTGNGYKLVELPYVSIEERVRFVLARTGHHDES
jgi:predicted ATPase